MAASYYRPNIITRVTVKSWLLVSARSVVVVRLNPLITAVNAISDIEITMRAYTFVQIVTYRVRTRSNQI